MFLVIIDSFSKWIEVIPTQSATADVTIKALRTVFTSLWLPSMIVSDNGPCFTSHEFTNFCKHNGIYHVKTLPHHPSSNGLAERAVQVFKHAMKKNNSGDFITKMYEFLLCYVQLLRAQLARRHLCYSWENKYVPV